MNCQDEILQKLTELRNTQLEMRTILTGNGEPAKGLVLKVDRLEQEEKRRTWMTRSILVAVIGLIAKSLFEAYLSMVKVMRLP